MHDIVNCTVINIILFCSLIIKESHLVKVGNDGAVCVKGEGGYSIAHQEEKGILCATWQFNKRACPHVIKLVSSINELQPDVPGFLIPVSRVLCIEAVKTKEHKDRPLASLQSSRPIPFKFPPALSSVLKLPFSEQFQIVERMCHLSESGHGVPSCSFCGHSEWDTGCPKSTTVLTQHQALASYGRCSIGSRYSIADNYIESAQ